ncbi:hypothetical protein [Janthinobacterium sp. MDT1-19]|uniref:hypothetical protein n=1 Tax=Janthinobacterium sp. MDT1-19 TaxID=1259339 RepID=UPI003F28CFD5
MAQSEDSPDFKNYTVTELKEQLEFIRAQEVKLQATYTEACKGLTLLNMGAVAAMLAMTQALIGKDVFVLVKNYALSGLGIFLAGAVLASVVFFFLMYRIAGSVATSPPRDNSLAIIPIFLFLSMLCFIAGASSVVWGLAVAY